MLVILLLFSFLHFFFFNDTATTEIYTLSLHDALPILAKTLGGELVPASTFDRTTALVVIAGATAALFVASMVKVDRKSTRLNSSHGYISYAVFCLKKKK